MRQNSLQFETRKKISEQCDQMVRFFYKIWPFLTKKICPVAYKICQRRLKIVPNTK